MSGKKGRSGRRPLSVELKRLQIIDKAWSRCETLIDDRENKFGDIVAKDIAVKNMPQEVTGQGIGNNIIVVRAQGAGDTLKAIPGRVPVLGEAIP